MDLDGTGRGGYLGARRKLLGHNLHSLMSKSWSGGAKFCEFVWFRTQQQNALKKWKKKRKQFNKSTLITAPHWQQLKSKPVMINFTFHLRFNF